MPGREEIRLDSSIYHGVDELRELMLNSTCFDLAYFSSIVMTDNHSTVINKKTGLYWVFSLEKATLVKAGKIFSDRMTPEMIAKGGFDKAVLHAFPEKAGTILVSTQKEAAFTTETSDSMREADELMKQHQQPGSTLTPRDVGVFIARREKEIAEKNPYIEWYRIYPENGKVEKLGLPPEGAALDREGGKNDFWRPMPDGSVRMGWVKVNHPEEPKQKQKAEVVQQVNK